MEILSLPNEPFLREVSALLAEGRHVTIRAKGNSMLPFIHDGDDVELYAKKELRVGDIALAYTREREYVLHRIVEIKENCVTLMGDGNVAGTEHCSKEDVGGVVLYVFDGKGRKKDCGGRFVRLSVWVWMHTVPLRRYVLGIYRRLCV